MDCQDLTPCKFHLIGVCSDTLLMMDKNPENAKLRNLIKVACQELSVSINNDRVSAETKEEMNGWADQIVTAMKKHRSISMLWEVREALFDMIDYVNTYVEPGRSCVIMRERVMIRSDLEWFLWYMNCPKFIKAFYQYFSLL